MDNTAGKTAICLATNKPATDESCPYGCEVCLGEECEEYFVAHSG